MIPAIRSIAEVSSPNNWFDQRENRVDCRLFFLLERLRQSWFNLNCFQTSDFTEK